MLALSTAVALARRQVRLGAGCKLTARKGHPEGTEKTGAKVTQRRPGSQEHIKSDGRQTSMTHPVITEGPAATVVATRSLNPRMSLGSHK